MDGYAEYELFSKLMLEDRLYLDRKCSFRWICKRFGMDRKSLNSLIIKELGLTGEGIIKAYRRAEEERIRKKYTVKGFKL
ncbi:MAG: hypothetical protein ACI3ZT_03030 [Candidatus Cryptobacteroides sp.]